jgi:hypothetical protein
VPDAAAQEHSDTRRGEDRAEEQEAQLQARQSKKVMPDPTSALGGAGGSQRESRAGSRSACRLSVSSRGDAHSLRRRQAATAPSQAIRSPVMAVFDDGRGTEHRGVLTNSRRHTMSCSRPSGVSLVPTGEGPGHRGGPRDDRRGRRFPWDLIAAQQRLPSGCGHRRPAARPIVSTRRGSPCARRGGCR